jgi:hypothetical protein
VFGSYRTPNMCETDSVNAEEAIEVLAQTLAGLHMPTLPTPAGDPGSDLILDLAGRRLRLQVKYYALIDRSRALHVLRNLDSGVHPWDWGTDVILVVVSDRIVDGARDQLREAGVSWFDLRGHLYVTGPGLLVDVATNRLTQRASSPRAFAGRVGLATAIDILLTRPHQAVVRETARRIGAAPSTVSTAMKSLRNEGLMDERGAVDLEALFWATAREWDPQWVPVGRYPHPDGPMRNPALKLGFDDVREPGWALGGDVAAAHLGAPIGLASGAAPDLYLPSRQAHRLACSILGEARETAAPAARLAVAPVVAVCEDRVDVAATRDEHWLIARPLFVALDLAQDPGRGAEILRSWNPDPRSVRVW